MLVSDAAAAINSLLIYWKPDVFWEQLWHVE